MNILALMPDSYHGFGGIAQYNRDLIDALAASDRVEKIVSLARHYPDSDSGLNSHPEKLVQQCLPGSSARYMMNALRGAMKSRADVILCGHIHMLPAAALIKKLIGRPLILEAYGIEAWQPQPGFRSWGIQYVDLVIAISRFTRELLMRWSGIDPHRIRVIPNAVHLNRYSNGEKPGYLLDRYGLQGKRVLLTLGRLQQLEGYKGQDRIITLLPKLINRFPDLVFMIVGDGSDRARLEEIVATLKLQDHVIFAGRIPEKEKVDHYNLADAFAMPSTSEGFGFVFLEAAACGLPVLGGRIDGSRDALVDGRLGVMIDPENTDELLDGLEEILERKKQVLDCLAPFDFPRFTRQIQELVIG
jgi:glycosyltransferase involved in cell wall biosynthesis